MFKGKEKEVLKSLPSNTPVNGMPDPSAIHGWYEKYGRPVSDKNRFFVISVVLGITLAISAFANFELFPLHKNIPYIVEVNSNGIPTSKPIPINEQKPVTHKELFYFASIWVRNLLTVDPGLSRSYLIQDYREAEGPAQNYINSFILQNPKNSPFALLKEHPTLRATVKINSISIIGSNNNELYISAFQNFTQDGKPAFYYHYLITLSFELVNEKTIADFYENPIGFKVTNLSITKGAIHDVAN